MRAIGYKSVLVIILLMLAVGFAVFRWWQGPLVQSYTAVSMPLVQTVVATGQVVTVSRTQVGSEVSGVVLERLVQEGDRVAKGDLLLVLSSDDIAAQVRQAQTELQALASSTRPQALVELDRAKVQLAQASRDVARRRELAAISAISAEEMEQAVQAENVARTILEAARLRAQALAAGGVEEALLRERLAALQAQLNKTEVRSEVSGTVLTRDVEPGDFVQPGRTLFTIALDGSTEIHVPLDERNLSRLALQQNAIAIADAYPERPFPARINFIAPSIDPQRGTVEVRLSVEPVPEFLRQDMTVSVNIETGRREQALVIANDALANVQADKAIVLLLRDGKVQRQQVTLGLRGLAMSEIVAGLSAGDQVMADATSSLANGERVRVVAKDMPFVVSIIDANTSDSNSSALSSIDSSSEGLISDEQAPQKEASVNSQ
ncbi:efflux RND transporter periplasmic adaptor subunit [Psychrobacter fulvigenes]|uniref:efflux RND transporter periplasmic adaptor subunit n=1 Tax=Psychrobacter fulvigenes TaxID=533323 RepID=UPI00191982B3|nr:efflux RND transporter periplasmic adaptor subunit [Psychrobacter fulvigenes]